MDFSLDTVESARLVALGAGIGVVAVLLTVLRGTWKKYRSFQRVSDAAALLVGVHVDAVADKAEALAAKAEVGGESAKRLARSTRSFSADIRELRYLMQLVPKERERLEATLVDIALPTKSRTRA